MSREQDALVAEHVMGYRWWHAIDSDGKLFNTLLESSSDSWAPRHGCTLGFVETGEPSSNNAPHYTSDAAADHAVLERVRETWDENRVNAWHLKLAEIWHDRLHGERRGFVISSRVINYRPGDYSRAALAALGIEVKQA